MSRISFLLALSFFVVVLPRVDAQQPARHPAVVADTSGDDDADVGEGRPGFQYGIASGALRYPGGRSEQGTGVVLRWVPVQWLSLSATPTRSRVTEPASASTPAQSRSGFVDLPLEASLSHAFRAPLTPTISAGLGVTLPVGDTATGFGSGELGYSATLGAGFSPTSNTWVHASAGRSLSSLSIQSAYGSGSGWADVGGGASLTDRLSAGAGYSFDFGDIDPTLGRSTSVSGDLSLTVVGRTTVNLTASHGLGGAAPDWSVALGIGTAFPYLNHLGAGSALDNLRNTFGGGSHGLGQGASGSASAGRGRKKG